jgi:DNA-binding GntR family transcriptional regulator
MYTRIRYLVERGNMALSDALRQEILSGRLAPGTALSQTEIAERFGVSRIPVRDALQQLALERLVTVVPGKGARVVSLTDEELNEVYDLRVFLECDLLRRAMRNLTEEDRREAEYALRKSDLEAGRPGWADGDRLFHAALYAPARRNRQLGMVEELRRLAMVHVAGYDDLAASTPDWIGQHRALFEAFTDGRTDEAVRRLEAHIEAARAALLARSGRPAAAR